MGQLMLRMHPWQTPALQMSPLVGHWLAVVHAEHAPSRQTWPPLHCRLEVQAPHAPAVQT